MNTSKKGFTLIELLIVIAILAVLSVAVVLVLNPAELLKQARDSTRISDMAALNSAIALYLTDVSAPGLGGINNGACSNKVVSTFATTTTGANPFVIAITPAAASASTTVDGSGWVSVNFAGISAGSPISRLPLDPVNNASFMYAYACNNLNYKLATLMESAKYSNVTTGYTRNSYDGGTSASWYEVGNTLAL